MDKVVRDGKVAVLYSPGFGAGWYSWNSKHPECLFAPTIVALVEAGRHDAIDEIAKTLFDDYFYTGGSMDLEIEWLPIGTAFEIHEYDGSESIRTMDSPGWHIA